MAMIRLRAAAGSDAETRLLFSSRGWDDIIYRDELERLERRRPHGRAHADAVAAARLDGLRAPGRRRDAGRGRPDPAERPRVYVCGPTPFVEAVARRSCSSGTSRRRVKTERFGPTGG